MTVHCASVLKPVYVAIAIEAGVDGAHELGERVIRSSDNAATDELVERIGGLQVLASRLSEMSGCPMPVPETWGRFLITEEMLEAIYVRMLTMDCSAWVVKHMIDVEPEQRFGAHPGVPVKGGWDVHSRKGVAVMVTNRVLLYPDGTGVDDVFVDERPIPPRMLGEWAWRMREYGPTSVVPLHLESVGITSRKTFVEVDEEHVA